MNYQVLARQWRPQRFSDVVGQTHVLNVLTNALTLGRIHHAYLFSGTRGVGKTSIARLFVKGLNCETGVTATPCGVCQNCIDIEQGRFIDLIEVDAASRTKVEDTREILDNVQYLPARGRYKVYLIDEVHMLSKSSFNALLKTLEEPPEYVKFLLATTDPQKLPVTVLSRCLHLHLQALSDELIQKQLDHILTQEQMSFEESATQLLAKAAEGSLRDALSLTDQAIALGGGAVTRDLVHQMLGLMDGHLAVQCIEAIHSGQGNLLMTAIADCFSQGVDWDALLNETMQLLHQMTLYQVVPGAIAPHQAYANDIKRLAHQIDAASVQLFYQILLEGQKSLTYAKDKRLCVEMTFLRALAFIPYSIAQSGLEAPPVQSSVSTSDADGVAMPSATEPSRDLAANSTSSKRTASAIPETTASEPMHRDDTPPPSSYHSEPHTQESSQTAVTSEPHSTAEEPTPKTMNLTEALILEREKIAKKSKAQNHRNTPERDLNASTTSTVSSFASKTSIQNDPPPKVAKENYQWQYQATSNESTEEIALPTEHSSLMHQIIERCNQKDSWHAMIDTMDLPPLVKQVALNAWIQAKEDHYTLFLRSSHQHLLQKGRIAHQLQELMSTQLEKPITLEIEINDDLAHATPNEWRQTEMGALQKEAEQTLQNDPNLSLIEQLFNTRIVIDEKTVRPV